MTKTAESDPTVCHYCGPTESELRPYGPGGSRVCFACATSTPEREQAAQNAFGTLLDAVGSVAPIVAIGGQEGPVPFDPACTAEATP